MTAIQPTGLLIRSIHFSQFDLLIGVGPVGEGRAVTGAIGVGPAIGGEPLTGVEVVDEIDDEAVTNDAVDEQPVTC
jgi:hypothetical protein